jgi:hypothetical protein
MSRTSKRRPDKRRTRVTTTYSIPELAQTLDKDEKTIRSWMAEGLQPMDDENPVLFFGWHFKQWHEAWWDSRLHKCQIHESWCGHCRKSQPVKLNESRLEKRPDGPINLAAICAVCGAKTNKTMEVQDAVLLQEVALGVMSETDGFRESSIMCVSACKIDPLRRGIGVQF